MIIGYVRVSSKDQNVDRQLELLKNYNIEKYYIEKVSGKDMTNREELKKLLSFIREGDVLITESISRLSRSTKDFLTIMDLLQSKNITFISIKENFDTSTAIGRFCLVLFSSLAELERENIKIRQAEGILAAKERGVYKGRQRIVRKEFDNIYEKWINKEITATEAIKVLKMSPSTFYRRVRDKKQEVVDSEANIQI